jgi:hypothetical protein
MPLTNTVARVVQWCFTTRMAATASRETIYDKSVRIAMDETRVHTIAANRDDFWLGTVDGDHGIYKVCAVSPEHAQTLGMSDDKLTSCTCKAGRRGKLCSHALVADDMRKRYRRGLF